MARPINTQYYQKGSIKKDNFPYFFQNNRIYFDSISFTLIQNEVFDSIKKFYSKGATKNKIGLNSGSFLANQTIEDTRQKLKKFLDFTKGMIFFPQSKGIGILSVLHSVKQKNSRVLAYSGFNHDLWIPIFEYTRVNKIELTSIPYYVSDDELISFISSKINSNNKNLENILVIPLRSLGNGYEIKLETINFLKKQFGLIIVLDFTNSICTKYYILDDFDFDFALFDSNIGFGGPVGQGIVLVKSEFMSLLKPYLIFGNNTVKEVTNKNYILEEDISKLETSINPPIIAGLNKALDLIEILGLHQIEKHLENLKNYLITKLKDHFPNIVIIGSGKLADYHNIISFVFPNQNMHEIAIYLDEVSNIDVRSGSLCAHQLIQQIFSRHITKENNMSYLGIIQLSLHYYNDRNDIDKLIGGIYEFMNLIN